MPDQIFSKNKKKVSFGSGEAETKLSFKEKLKIEWDKYGLIASFLITITLLNGFIWNIANHAIERADKQAEANYRIGKLEGQIETLLNDSKEPQNINHKLDGIYQQLKDIELVK